MVVRQRTDWVRMLFIWKGSVLKKVLPQLTILLVWSVCILTFRGKIYEHKVQLNPTIFTLLGLSLAIFMGFVNTASYDRYWEGRKLWGSLLIESRNLARLITTVFRSENLEVPVKLIAGFSWALNEQLRNADGEKLQEMLPPEQFAELQMKKFRPVIILNFLADWASEHYRNGKIDSIIFTDFNAHLKQLSQIVGGCERIANTPLPFPYRILLHRSVYIYCFLLPFGLVDAVSWMMPLIVVFIGYTFIALDALIQEIEEPFGSEENDLPLNTICRNIEYSVFEIAGLPVKNFEESSEYFRD